MNRFRVRFGIMQCILALLLLLGAPNSDFGAGNTAAAAVAPAADAIVLASQPPNVVYKHETASGICIVKRNDDHNPGAIGTATAEEVDPPRWVHSRKPDPPPLHLWRHRVLAAPPTGPPSA
jgi:hypothetical protein